MGSPQAHGVSEVEPSQSLKSPQPQASPLSLTFRTRNWGLGFPREPSSLGGHFSLSPPQVHHGGRRHLHGEGEERLRPGLLLRQSPCPQ